MTESDDLRFRVLSGNPTATELAAVTAVLTKMVQEESQRMPEPDPSRSAWSLSQRALRQELVPGFGVWNHWNR